MHTESFTFVPSKKKAPKILSALTVEERLILQAADLTWREGKFLYRHHRNAQTLRKSIGQAILQLKKEQISPPEVFQHFRRSATRLEKQTNAALEIYADQHVPTRWMRAVGLGIAQAVGIFSLIEIEKVGENVSSLHRFCGYDPNQTKITKKEAGECVRYFQEEYKKDYVDEEVIYKVAAELNRGPRQLLRITGVGTKKVSTTWGALYKAIMSYPWSQELKEILFRVGMQFRCVGGNGLDIPPYRSVYVWRKEYEVLRNEAGVYADQAAHKIASRTFRKDRTAYGHYSEGRLPPLHIDARARRFTVKIFLVHLHQIMYYERYGKMPPRPYILDVLGKEREIVCPKWPFR